MICLLFFAMEHGGFLRAWVSQPRFNGEFIADDLFGRVALGDGLSSSSASFSGCFKSPLFLACTVMAIYPVITGYKWDYNSLDNPYCHLLSTVMAIYQI